MFENLKKKYQEIFGKEPEILVRAPGRVNLIGEHTDHEGGYVFPIAVGRYVYCLGSKREDGKLKIYSFNYDQFVEVDLKKIAYSHQFPWANYIFGVVKNLKEEGIEISGVEMLVGGDVPIGGGLSSSAALEISVATFLQKLSKTTLNPLEVVKLAQKAENEFVGVSCGIM
ncbi:MAG TPA: galactokinase, partial [bacterium]|nr:galactokinase [bacterium]HEX67618.1 galactokinase [bacterium]